MVQQLAQRDIGGDIGRAFSQSLSEQLPKEMQSQRLSQAYKNLNSQKTEPGQIPDISGFLSIPGGAELLQSIMPLIRQQAYLKSQQTGMAPSTGQPTPGGLPMAQDEAQVAAEQGKENKRFFKTASELEEEAKTFKKPPSPGSFFREEEQLAYQNQQEQFEKAKEIAKEGISQVLHQEGLQDYRKLEGELLENANAHMQSLINQGYTAPQAFQAIKPHLLDISRDLTALRESNIKGGDVNSSIKLAAKRFKEKGLEERFPFYAANIFNVTPSKISSIIEPVENEKFNSLLKPYKLHIPSIGFERKVREPKKTFYDTLAKSINLKKDNLASMMQKLSDEGLDPDKFKRAVQRQHPDLPKTKEYQLLKNNFDWYNRLKNRWFSATRKTKGD